MGDGCVGDDADGDDSEGMTIDNATGTTTTMANHATWMMIPMTHSCTMPHPHYKCEMAGLFFS
jgi:hypothetical protein